MPMTPAELADLVDLEAVPDLPPGKDRFVSLIIVDRDDPAGPDPDLGPVLLPMGQRIVTDIVATLGVEASDVFIVSGTSQSETEHTGAMNGADLLAAQ